MLFKCCLLLLMSYEISSSNILGLFTSPHRSHMLVYVGVIRGLLQHGHNITIVTVLPVENIIPKKVRVIQLKMPPEPERMHGIFRQIAVISANSRTLHDPRFEKFLEEENRFDLVILGYLFNDYQLGVAAHFNCPSVVIWTTQPISFVNRFVGNPNGWLYVPHPSDHHHQMVGVRGVLYGFFDSVFKWILDFIMNEVYCDLFPAPKYPSLGELRKNVSLVFCNHHFSEGPISAQLPSIIEISGIQIESNQKLPKTLQNFMDSAEHGVIYFSLGTVVSAKQLKPKILNIFFKVLSSLPQKVIWKIDSVPRNFSNILIGTWFPQSAILAHSNIKLFLTHGGKGSTIEALHYAVPMIAIPIFGDQFADAHRLEKNGFGFKLETEGITESSFRARVVEVLNNSTYSEKIRSASMIYKDRPLSAEETAVYWIEYVIRHRGAPHLQSPIVNMNFVQYLNIDVFVFCICLLHLKEFANVLCYAIKICTKKTVALHFRIRTILQAKT